MKIKRGLFIKSIGASLLTGGFITACSPDTFIQSDNNSDVISPASPPSKVAMCNVLGQFNDKETNKLSLQKAGVSASEQRVILEELGRPISLSNPKVYLAGAILFASYDLITQNREFNHTAHVVRISLSGVINDIVAEAVIPEGYLSRNIVIELGKCEVNQVPSYTLQDAYYTISSFTSFPPDYEISGINGCGETQFPIIECRNIDPTRESDI